LRKEGGNSLLLVVMVVAVLSMGFGTYMQSLANYRSLQERRLLGDRALMAAEAGIAEETGTLANMSTPPTADITTTYALPTAQFAPFENVTVTVHMQTQSNLGYWTITSTAASDASLMRGPSMARRVQVTLQQQNFAKYELFASDFGGVWSPGYLNFLGAGMVYMGPININSGVGFFPDLYCLSQVTCAATGGEYVYPDFGSYVGGVYGNNAANNEVSIMNYWSSTYSTAPQFYGGLTVTPTPTDLPTNMSSNSSSQALVDNAGLTLPDNYTGYNAAAGPNFVITLSDPYNTSANGQVDIKQYLGTANGVPQYGPAITTTVGAVNGAIVVKGNVVSLSGTLSGRLTIGALAASSDPSGGNVNITGNLMYKQVANNPGFQYADPNTLINAPTAGTPNGSVNQTQVTALQGQLTGMTDMLGVVSEGNVTIKQNDLNGNPVGNSMSNPLYIDAVVMATGASTSAAGSGGFAVENFTTRPPGQVNFLGGMIQNVYQNWALFNSSGITNGLNQTELWDKRASEPAKAPPFFPTTSGYAMLTNSWNSSYVQNASTPITYPVIP
jgi:hypothetical protein